MNIREELLKEHSLANARKIAAYASADDGNLQELFDSFTSNEYRVAQRAAWAVSQVADKNPQQIMPYIPILVSKLQEQGIHLAVVRNAVRILQQVEIPDTYHGEVMNACFRFVEDPETPVAIKAFSLTTLDNLSRQYPEIRQELKLIIENRWEHESAAFRARARRILLRQEKPPE